MESHASLDFPQKNSFTQVFMSNIDFSKDLIAGKDKEVTLQQCKPVYYIFYVFWQVCFWEMHGKQMQVYGLSTCACVSVCVGLCVWVYVLGPIVTY